MYLLISEGTVHGLFTTKEKAESAKTEVIEKEIAEWLTNGCGKDEILAEATDDERKKYEKGILEITNLSSYPYFYRMWEDSFPIVSIEPNEIKQIWVI